MPPGLRRLGWAGLLVSEAVLVLAATAYVGAGTRDFWLVLLAALVAVAGYAVAERMVPPPTLGEAGRDPQRWYWF